MNYKILNRISIRKKLLFITIVGVLIPIGIMLFAFIFQMKREYDIRKDVMVDSLVERLTYNVNSELKEVHNTLFSYVSNIELSTFLDSEYNQSNEFLDRMDSKLALAVFSEDVVTDLSIFYDNDAIDYSGDYIKNVNAVASEDWYQNIKEKIQYLNIVNTFEDGKGIIKVTKSLNSVNYTSPNIISATIDGDRLKSNFNDKLLDELGGQVYLVNADGQIVTSNKTVYADEASEILSVNTLDLENKNTITSSLGDEYYFRNWYLYFVIDRDVLAYDFIGKSAFVVTFTLLIAFAFMIINNIVSGNISKRLIKLTRTMDIVETGELIEIAEDMGSDEIGQSVSMFNTMIGRIRHLIDEVQREKEKADQLVADRTLAYDEIKQSMKRIEAQSRQINELVYNDSLTGLKNRLAITEHIELQLNALRCNTLGVLFLDVDNFKFINDTYGHDLGDEVIKATAGKISKIKTENIEIGRFGGDEFLIVVKNCGHTDDVLQLTTTLQDEFLSPVLVSGKKFYLTVSIGVSLYPAHGLSNMDLIKKADLALYDAKDAGRNITKIYQEQLDVDLEEKIAFQNAIKEAFSKEEFYLNFQPYYNAQTLDVVGFESLIRWKSEIYGQVSPFKLITHAESMGLIIDLGEWIIKESCQFAKKVNQISEKAVNVSINISMIQLLSHDFYDRIMDIINDVGIDPHMIILEMTETILIDSMDRGADIVGRLRNVGFGIALDDFGTGYSSLSYLKTIPVSVLKIDKAFVDEIASEAFDTDFVKIIIELAHKRGLSVTAEGVETADQVEVLKALNCDMLQGYYINKPLCEVDALGCCNK